MSFITIKLKKAKAPTRLAYFDVWPSWGDLASKIVELYNISQESISVTFFDEAKDTVTIASEEELQYFYEHYEQSSKEIKFVVQDRQFPDPALASTWSADSNLSGLSGNDDQLTLFCWVLNVSDDPFPVDIGKSMTVGHMKEVIKKKKERTFDGIEPDTFKLWKLSPPIPSTEIDTKLKGVQNPRQIPGSVKLNPPDGLSEHFPSPPRKHLHIIVEAPPIRNNQVKRPGAPDVDREESKKPRIDMFLSEPSLGLLHERLQNIDPDSSRYSDPRKITNFPFPFVGRELPAERFDLKEFHFDYIGRTVFSELLQTVEELEPGGGYTRLYIQGTMGYGKSHILAVLAGLLSRNGKRVVYLPDCQELVRATMPYMRTALLCAFADPPLFHVRNEIRALGSQDDIIRFCLQYPGMYFIIDQMNALDHEGPNMDMVDNLQKVEVQKFLHQLTSGQFQITSASANHKTAMHMKKKQTNERKLSLMGGMSEDEMQQWWIHHQKRVPIFEAEDKARVEDLTGRIPLLLRPLLRFTNKPFHEIEQEFWTHRDLVAVNENIQEFSREKEEKEGEKYGRYYLPTLVDCVTSAPVRVSRKWFDYRYFFDVKGIGNCTCGLARQAAAVVIRRGSPGLLCDNTWIRSLHTFRKNPPVVGFLVEQACLSTIATTGFHHGSITWQSFSATTFKDDLLRAFGRESDEKFFIPEDPFFKDIDALYLKVDAEKKTAAVVPIQVTVAKIHKDSEAAFYSRWTDWQSRFAGYALKTNFVWIVEDKQSWMVKEEEFRTTRKLKLMSPQHEQIFVTVQDINAALGWALKSIR